MQKKQWNVGILLFDGVEILDYSGPYEVFSLTVYEQSQIAKLFSDGIDPAEKPFVVKTISYNGEIITSNNGLKIVPDFSMENLNVFFDILIIPGGPLFAIKSCYENMDIINWVKDFYKTGGMVASVCSGATILAEAGLLTGKKATTHWYAIPGMKNKYVDIEVIENVRFVDQGNVITSAGVSAGIEMSLHIVERLLGENVAKITANLQEYPYWPIK